MFGVLAAVLLGLVTVLVKYVMAFQHRCCKHCGKQMEFKGEITGSTDTKYLFHCRQCDSLEQISKEEFLEDTNIKTSEA